MSGRLQAVFDAIEKRNAAYREYLKNQAPPIGTLPFKMREELRNAIDHSEAIVVFTFWSSHKFHIEPKFRREIWRACK